MDCLFDVYPGNSIEEKSFDSKVKFSQEAAKLFATGVVFSSVEKGICHMRPEVLPVTDCKLLLKVLNSVTGETSYYRFIFKEKKYEALRFS